MEQDTVSPDFIKGFNHGYYLQKDQPALFEKLNDQAKEDSPYWNGFRDGADEYKRDRSPLKDTQNPSKDFDMDRE